MRILGAAIGKYLLGESGATPFAFGLIAILAAILIAAAAAAFDPRGSHTILNDALPSSLGAIGLVWVGFVMSRRYPAARIALAPSLGWIVAGAATGTLLVAAVGPGLRF
jgi:hypothetical protein